MKIVIDIPEKTYKYYNTLSAKGEVLGFAERAIMLGTPLPEHHGRLIDADALEEKVENHREMLKISQYDRDLVLHYTDIEMAPTIIEGSNTE